MNPDYTPTEPSKSLLAALFTGIGVVCTSLIYNFLFGEYSGLPFSQIIFGSLILMAISEFLFNVFHHEIDKGAFFFRVFFIVLIIIAILLSMNVKRRDDILLNSQFMELLVGILIIFGISGSFTFPLLFKSNKIWIIFSYNPGVIPLGYFTVGH